ncbi:MAG: hypothetical protein KBT27_09280 [Prevotellaceae bacterium]|nr:hypothetical protein [Candidatus Faecinaster equi]
MTDAEIMEKPIEERIEILLDERTNFLVQVTRSYADPFCFILNFEMPAQNFEGCVHAKYMLSVPANMMDNLNALRFILTDVVTNVKRDILHFWFKDEPGSNLFRV